MVKKIWKKYYNKAIDKMEVVVTNKLVFPLLTITVLLFLVKRGVKREKIKKTFFLGVHCPSPNL